MRDVVRGGFTAAVVAAGLVAGPGQAVGEAACTWEGSVLPVPSGIAGAGVNAADGEWFAGWGAEDGGGLFPPTPAMRWHDGTVESLGFALGQATNVYGVSPTGTVVGAVLDPGWTTSAVVHRDGRWEALPKLGTSSWAYDVNTSGDIVGYDQSTDPQKPAEHLVVWPHDDQGAERLLPLPDGTTRSFDTPRIDDDGTVVTTRGRMAGIHMVGEGYVWRPGAQAPTRLAPLYPDDSVMVTDIRDGHIVGTSSGDTTSYGVEWDLDGRIVQKFDGEPKAVNQDGYVLGRMADDSWVVWGEDSQPEAVTLPAGASEAFVYAIGDEAVGGQAHFGGKTAAVSWQRHC